MSGLVICKPNLSCRIGEVSLLSTQVVTMHLSGHMWCATCGSMAPTSTLVLIATILSACSLSLAATCYCLARMAGSPGTISSLRMAAYQWWYYLNSKGLEIYCTLNN